MGGMKNNPWPMFPRITCRVLVLEGEISENRLYTKLEKASSLMPRGSYTLFKDAGHFIPMERPEEVTTVIKNFFREVNN
jgi:pimeloyl-ACP methyl ester carboxylesterase